MKSILWFLILLPSLCLAGQGMGPGPGVKAYTAGSSTCTTRLSDDFTRANSDTIGNGWTEADGQHSISSNTLYSTVAGALVNSTSFSTATAQWGKIKLTSSTEVGLALRTDTADFNPVYVLICSGSGVQWLEYDSVITDSSGSMTCSSSDSFGAMITGTGTDTAAHFWKNPTNNSPYSAGSACSNTALPCWDSAGDPPDITLSGDPTVPANTNLGLGLINYASTTATDDAYFGDCSN